ncbi:DUF3848 domain-containing protein [Anaerotruncus colihominis]|nr:DUF3848 domain-containing protein [Anaerotruncus colihominis]MCR2027042.1 DUF3848 domain-containing protein [Anaerotruncus colihominis]
MANPNLLNKLYQRMSAEQEQYRKWLLGQPLGDILNHAAEYTVREDIVMEMSALELPEAQAKALLKSKTPLADVYKEWNKTETHHMEDLRDVIEARADAVIRAEKERSQREGR